MIPQLSDEISWAMRVGARLQMLQASFADDDAASRTGYIEEEVEHALRDVPAARRAAYLQALAERFPSWESRAAAAAPAASQFPTQQESPAETPEALVNRLAAMAAGLSNDARWSLSYRLQQAGFAISVPTAAASEVDEVPPELQRRLSIEAGQTIDRKRALRLTAVLIDLVVTMDQVAWSLWKNLAPNSIVRRDPGATGDLKKLAGPYLLGDNEVSTTGRDPRQDPPAHRGIADGDRGHRRGVRPAIPRPLFASGDQGTGRGGAGIFHRRRAKVLAEIHRGF